jgi:hypothetical protein
MAVGFPTKANWAAGDVLTASAMDDLAGTVNTVQWLKPWNQVLNSNMSVWQRGTSFSIAASTSASSSTYLADRWQTFTNANQAVTITRQSTNDTTNLPFIQYCTRYQRNSGQTGTGTLYLGQSFESVNSIPFAGKTVTLSFYARAGANYSASSNVLAGGLYSGTGTDQNVLQSYTTSTSVIAINATLTSSWQRFSFSGTVSSAATELGILFAFNPTGTAGANDYFEVTGVQLEQGSVANTYQPNQATYQGELAACQRYYQRYGNAGFAAPALMCYFGSTTLAIGVLPFITTMRTAPSGTASSTSAVNISTNGSYANTSAITFYASTPNAYELRMTYSGVSITGQAGSVEFNSSGYFELSSEL